MKITLPDGGWAEIRDPEKVPERLRRPITLLSARLSKSPAIKAVADGSTPEGVDEGDLATMFEINDVSIVALVASWSFDLPVSLESLSEIPGDAYDALRDESAKHMTALLPSFGADPAKDSPTDPSSD